MESSSSTCTEASNRRGPRSVRRIAHGILSLGIVYYWLPDPLFDPDFPKWFGLVIIVLIVGSVEIVRLRRSKIFFGMRPYEVHRIGSYVYAVAGIFLVLTFAPPIVGIPCILGMAWVDPIAGELRNLGRREYVVLPIMGFCYAAISYVALLLLSVDASLAIALILIMTPVAVVSEAIDLRYLDDDLTMVLFPAIAGTLVVLITV